MIDVSSSGALVHGTTRLLPGTHVDVHVTARQGRTLVRARVVRCAVWEVSADVVQYRGALSFTMPVDLQPIDLAAIPVLTDPQVVENPQPLQEGLSRRGHSVPQ